ncbi:DUF4350 domain-containing protein [Polaribacter gochangensis]|uniref:DUF4350 domain-containing protein n=1 Tax=Polaribacter gochangensis TaxID=3252903 RepID=UPI0039047816
MDKKLKIYFSVFILMFALIIFMEASKPKPINWFPSYATNHTIPYGTFVFTEEFKKLFKDTEFKTITEPPYQFLKDTTQKGTYFFVDGTLNFGKVEFEELLQFVARGNEVFMSTNGVNIDTLNLKTKQLATHFFKEASFYKLLNKNLDTTEYKFDRKNSNLVFSEIDTLKTTVLGKLIIKDSDSIKGAEGVNFIKYKYGKGQFYFHTFPLAFTNYSMLKDANHQYISSVLSYIDESKPIFYDGYYKTGKSKITSPMHYILSSYNLRWAYYTALIGVLFFVVFKGKRTQRIIPVIASLKNQTVAFTRTIAMMYYHKSEHKNIAEHKINYFLEYIRSQLHISTLTIDTAFYKTVALRSGNAFEDVQDLFKNINTIQNLKVISKEQLIALNSQIEQFKKQRV